MKKIVSEYKEHYGDIPKDEVERFSQLLQSLKLSKRTRDMISPKLDEILNMSWETINFVIYLLPKATPRPRHNILRNTFYVQGARDNKEIFQKFMDTQNLPMIVTPCKFYCTTYYPIPNSMNDIEKILAELKLVRPISKPDWDNVGKTYSDMVQGSLLYDDALIIEGTSKKFYSTKPRIEISISYMKSFDCAFNQRKIMSKLK